MKYPLVDLFAGPGGLGEGFSSYTNTHGERVFDSIVSIEKEKHSYDTLVIRHFVRQFKSGELPSDYYDFLAGEITLEILKERFPLEFVHATKSVFQLTLGEDPHENVHEIIDERLKKSDKWVLVGGPPCQAYSLAGRSRMGKNSDFELDTRHTLYIEYLRIIADHKPPIFVMENVKGLLSATIEGKSTIKKILRDLNKPVLAITGSDENLEYKLYSLVEDLSIDEEVNPKSFVVRAENYGVPQSRHRMFIVGVRSDIKIKPGKLKPSEAPTVEQVIGDLPSIRSGLSKSTDTFDNWLHEVRKLSRLFKSSEPDFLTVKTGSFNDDMLLIEHPKNKSSIDYPISYASNQILNFVRDNSLKTLQDHDARSHMNSDIRRYFFASLFAKSKQRSPRLNDFPVELLPEHQNVQYALQNQLFNDRFRVQVAGRVATTITSHISKDGHYFIHYDPAQCRSLTVREAARLQTFPDNYFFSGTRTAKYHQVGNAVPPFLAYQIANIVADVLDKL